MGKAIKIIDIDETGEAFILNEKALSGIFSKVPSDLEVSIISVIGAFRTGKSFLLDFFLRYLRETSYRDIDLDLNREPRMEWMTKSGALLEGNQNRVKGDAVKEGGFSWKHGTDRCTTGIWLWSEYFIRISPKTQKEVAVFLMDTQGMHDSKTGQHLTASIFGLGTLLSSYTVFNLFNQIQEDHLQHLALFSEYGRVANNEASKVSDSSHPFQYLEFLVRDFRNFSDLNAELDVLHEEMEKYLQGILSSRFQKDLKEVRDQIDLCYEKVSCFCLPTPGDNVAEDRSYNGDISTIRPHFKRLLADYIRRVFTINLAPKIIQGHPVTAMELFEYTKVYCRLFRDTKIFPEAMTLFRATQEANIAAAIVRALACYKRVMDKKAGPGSEYLKDETLYKHHKRAVEEALEEFAAATKIGAKATNKEAEKNLKKQIADKFRDYQEANRLRDPMAFVAPYVIPLMIALGAYVMRYILETLCPRRSYTCLDFADFFGSLYFVIISFLIFHMLSTFYGVKQHLGGLMSLAKPKAD